MADETAFNHSEKGSRNIDRLPRKRGGIKKKTGISDEKVSVVIMLDRSKSLDLKVIRRGLARNSDIEKYYGNRVKEGSTLCTDKSRIYPKFAENHKLEYKSFNASLKQRGDKVHSVQTVNNMCKQVKEFMKRFNGVASKYLQNYMNWFRFSRLLKESNDIAVSITDYAMNETFTIFRWKNRQVLYEHFLTL